VRLENENRQRYEQERIAMTALMQQLQAQIQEQNRQMVEMRNRPFDSSSSSGCSIM